MQIKSITLEIELEDGTVVHGSMAPTVDHRWGANVEALGACVYPMTLMRDAVEAGDCWVREES